MSVLFISRSLSMISATLVCVLAGCAPGSQGQNATRPISAQGVLDRWTKEADKAWPQGRPLHDYGEVLRLLRTGSNKDALSLAAKTAAEPLILAPDTALTDETRYSTVYTCGRIIPVMRMLREIQISSESYAGELIQMGRYQQALGVYATNLSIAQQVVHAEPRESTPVLNGVGMWIKAWRSVGSAARARGDATRAAFALECVDKAESFIKKDVQPLIAAQQSESDRIRALNASKGDAYISHKLHELRLRYLGRERQLPSRWDREVQPRTLIGHLQAR